MTIDTVAAVRRFNRFYTNLIGVLRAGLLNSPYSLAEARVLYELGAAPAPAPALDVADLRQSLDMDAGYLSRILGRFEGDGLVVRERSDADARKQRIRLTDAGRAAQIELARRSDAQAAVLLANATEADQRRLVGAMNAIESVLGERAPARPAVVLREPGPGDLGWVVQRHGALYAAEYGWNDEFEAMVARIVADYLQSRDPRWDRAWIAEVDGEPVGSIFCVRASEGAAKLRLLLVEPKARGMGVGGRLVDECIRFARRAGYQEMVLFTHDVLAEARRLYQRAGFVLDREERRPAYGQDHLVHQDWRLKFLNPAQ
ncbi:bifunctional helix-turn-helix transcriptional regulator/GNAT family N-acetyltransferase [Dactylosporangium sp. CA-092794]|uniref:bifunctional helix-turn-helix transcriptional regulator/GNAT family N-acetyltransferase n=1 Tax=Dactylosporangium sp. CA-092794 TaxID=3239929 RepID=UPI003D8C904A